MGETKPAKPTKKEIERAEGLWVNFTAMAKWTTIAICATLAVMAAVFIR